MSEMHALSELYEESDDLLMDVMPGDRDLPPAEVGSAGREPGPNPAGNPAGPQLREAGPRAEEGDGGLAQRPGPGEQPGQFADPDFESEGEELDDWEDEYNYPEEQQLSGAAYRVPAALEEAKLFLRTPRAEAARDGGFQMHYEKTPFDQLAFIEELFSLMVVNRLSEELGCDEIIERE